MLLMRGGRRMGFKMGGCGEKGDEGRETTGKFFSTLAA